MLAILIADDEPGLPEFLALALRDAGYAVDIVRNGSEGLQRASERRYLAIVSDDVMPIMDGAALRRALLDRGDGTYFVLMSANPVAVMRARCPTCDAYLRKPFPMRELLAALQGAGRGQQANG